ncbi:hypothetical protein ACJJTC_010954 [Scirpophaga incertulas]
MILNKHCYLNPRGGATGYLLGKDAARRVQGVDQFARAARPGRTFKVSMGIFYPVATHMYKYLLPHRMVSPSFDSNLHSALFHFYIPEKNTERKENESPSAALKNPLGSWFGINLYSIPSYIDEIIN